MKQQDYQCSFDTTASPHQVFEAIRRVPEWWTSNTTGSSANLNDVFAVHFGDTFVDMKLIEFVTDKKIVWEATDCYLDFQKDKLEWKGTRMVWDISSENNQTRLTMTHVGLLPGVECFEECSDGWNFYIKKSLFKLITDKVGLPDTDRAKRKDLTEI